MLHSLNLSDISAVKVLHYAVFYKDILLPNRAVSHTIIIVQTFGSY